MHGNLSMNKTPDDNEFHQNDTLSEQLRKQGNKAVSSSHDKTMAVAMLPALVSCATTLIPSVWIFLLVQMAIHVLMVIAFAFLYHVNLKGMIEGLIRFPTVYGYRRGKPWKNAVELICGYGVIILVYVLPRKLLGWLGRTMNDWLAGRIGETPWAGMFETACQSKLFPWIGATVNAFVAGLLTWMVVMVIYGICEAIQQERQRQFKPWIVIS